MQLSSLIRDPQPEKQKNNVNSLVDAILSTPVTLVLSLSSSQIRAPFNVCTVSNSRIKSRQTPTLAKHTNRNARFPLRHTQCNFISCAVLLLLIIVVWMFLAPDTSRGTEARRLTPDTVATPPAIRGGEGSG
jgi:hypothetical protein